MNNIPTKLEHLQTALENFEDTMYIIFDETGHIIYPSNVLLANKFLVSINLTNTEGEYYNSYYDKYYRLDTTMYQKNGHTYKVYRYSDITKYKKQIHKLEIDETTGIYQKRKIYEEFRSYIEEALSIEKDFSVIMGDADFFKKVNDTYGHPVGDDVLNSIAQTMHNNIRHEEGRPQDLIGRVGGEEFLLVLKNIRPDISLKRMDSIRGVISSKPIISGEHTVNITMSFGIAHFPYETVRELVKQDSIEEASKKLMKKADDALYISKTTGRNKVSLIRA